ncbi:hypothetical protein Taro_045518 [Colocasia esculenta]|uniref:CCHC-type domain-containing protein n=1 Tax=Colocasia esculenta TaxID=4460 RepID=A0A843WRI0_COLES|nr:hypothetical protein [Colocasia esculenta]
MGEQQDPVALGPTVLPPLPPVDYGVFMQGLLQFPRSMAMVDRPSLRGKCLKCGSTEHQIRDCPRLQQFATRGAPAPAAAAEAAPVIGKPGRPRAQARVYALAREDAEQAENITEDMLAVESGVEAEELEVLLSVHTPADETGVAVFEEDIVRSDSEREEL